MGFPRWAPLTWYIFHKFTLEYIPEQKEHYTKFFEAMKTVIPCKTCRNHFIHNISQEENLIETNICPEKIFDWTVRLHNEVNKHVNKRIYTVEEAKKLYSKPLIHNSLMSFMNDYMVYNLNKGAEKDAQLLILFTQLCYLHPNKQKRDKLINFVQKMPLTKANIRAWMFGFYRLSS